MSGERVTFPNGGRDADVAMKAERDYWRHVTAAIVCAARGDAAEMFHLAYEVELDVVRQLPPSIWRMPESPIEWALLFELRRLAFMRLEKLFASSDRRFDHGLTIDIQRSIECWDSGPTHTVDLVVENNKCSIVIECDGHEFHERTKEQAERDRKRDRDLQFAGYTVLRFTGSEIVRDAAACAEEVFRFLDCELDEPDEADDTEASDEDTDSAQEAPSAEASEAA